MSITGYAIRFAPLRLLTTIAEQAYNVAGFLLNSGKPLQTSAAPVPHSPRSEDAAEGPPPIAPDSVSGGGHPNVEDIVDEYWDTLSSKRQRWLAGGGR